MNFKEYLTENKIVGPALIDPAGNILVQGVIGDSHASLLKKGTDAAMDASNWPLWEKIRKAFEHDPSHVFIDSNKNVLNRFQAADVARKAGQLRFPAEYLQSDNLKNE